MKTTINKDIYSVTVLKAPVSERYWSPGCIALVQGNQIRVGGKWFDFDAYWVVKQVKI